MTPLTKEQGIKIQTQHLNNWKSVLTPNAFQRLQEIVTKDNDSAISGFDIVRGNRMNEIIHNQIMNKV